MSDEQQVAELKAVVKSLKRERATARGSLIRAIDSIVSTNLALKELGQSEEAAAVKPPKKKAASKPAKKAAGKPAPKAAAKSAPPAAAPAPPQVEAWKCSGNVLTGDACVGGKGSDVRAADTRHEKKSHQTCKACKKLINKTRAAQKPKAAPAAAGAAADDDEQPEEALAIEREASE